MNGNVAESGSSWATDDSLEMTVVFLADELGRVKLRFHVPSSNRLMAAFTRGRARRAESGIRRSPWSQAPRRGDHQKRHPRVGHQIRPDQKLARQDRCDGHEAHNKRSVPLAFDLPAALR
jgi:hypothetical protein